MARKLPDTVRFDGVVFRYANYDTPLWVRPNSSPGRWNVAGDPPTQYFSSSANAAWAELARAENLVDAGELAMASTIMWAVDLHTEAIVDYTDFDKAKWAGLSPESLISDDYASCQNERNRLVANGYRGILGPSAALPGAMSLTVFGARAASQWGVLPRLASCMACCAVARGAPADCVRLVEQVRYFGQEHAGHLAYVRELER
jgi:RES domain-containing protein